MLACIQISLTTTSIEKQSSQLNQTNFHLQGYVVDNSRESDTASLIMEGPNEEKKMHFDHHCGTRMMK